MTDKKTGGPAFVEFEKCGDLSVRSGGLTMRDYFAAKAMQALIANPDNSGTFNFISKRAYAIADAMLEARND